MFEKISGWNSHLERQKVVFKNITVRSTLLDRIKGAQKRDFAVQKQMKNVEKGELSGFNMSPEGILRYRK